MRLVTSHIYKCFEKLPEFKLNHVTDSEVTSEEWSVFSICYNVESMTPGLETYRNQLQNLEKLTYDKSQVVMCSQTDFKTIPLRYLCGTLYVNFRLIWEPVTKIIASYGKGMDSTLFWSVFGEELKNVNHNIYNPTENKSFAIESNCDFLMELFDSQKCKSKPNYANYRILLWQSLSLFANVAEAKTRDVSDAFLTFIE